MCALIPQLFSCLLMHGEGGECFALLQLLNQILFFDCKSKSLTICNVTPETASHSSSPLLSSPPLIHMYSEYISLFACTDCSEA